MRLHAMRRRYSRRESYGAAKAAAELRSFAERRDRVTISAVPAGGQKIQGMRLHALCICGTPGGNRTHNGPLGGGCYIHLTTEAYDVLPPRHGGKTKYYSTILFPKKQIILRKATQHF